MVAFWVVGDGLGDWVVTGAGVEMGELLLLLLLDDGDTAETSGDSWRLTRTKRSSSRL